MKLGHIYVSTEWALLKRFSGLDIKGQGQGQTEFYNGAVILYFDHVASRLSCFSLQYETIQFIKIHCNK